MRVKHRNQFVVGVEYAIRRLWCGIVDHDFKERDLSYELVALGNRRWVRLGAG